MKITLFSIGNKVPTWVAAGYQEYAKRLPSQCQLELVEIPLKTRRKHADIKRLIQGEGNAMLKAINKTDYVVALEISGQAWSTQKLSQKLQSWQYLGSDIAILIGGPEGLAPQSVQRVDESWSLSRLTFPHPLVRVIVAEQIYRAWSLLQGHPYHK